jgi:SecD/SecF fusion protein
MPWHATSLLAQVAPQQQASSLWYVNLLVAVGTLAASFFLGGYFGKKLRMPEHGWKIGLCLFTLLATVAVLLMGPKIKLGIDLSGGAILVYQVDPMQKKAGETVDMDKLIAAVARRVNPGGQKEVNIRKYGVEQIEVVIPEKEEAEVARIKRIISTTGNLQFRILANNRDNKELIERALADPSKMEWRDAANKREAWWAPVKPGQEQSFSGGDIARRIRKVGGRDVLEVLVLSDIYDVTGGYLTSARPGTDRRGQPCVNFRFNSAGAALFGQMTGDHLPDPVTDFHYRLGILLDGELYSAPNINDRITESGEISGGFTNQEVQDLVNVLNAGSLPAALAKEPISELYSGPTLGSDTITKSTRAMIISSILVPLFMLVYYRFSGLVADIVLVLNMLMVFAIMLTINAAFTLTGFAGLALSVGMAVDNNVLIYERLREELERGATLRMAIRNAFQRASATIIDANLTTLIAATVLYVIGSDQVKGFAVTLWLGVAISIFTSVFVSRVIFDVAEKRQWFTQAKMLRIIGHTNFDFMGLFRYCLIGSILITVMAIVVSFYRGVGLFDIDFTGGVSVQALFDAPQQTAEVRGKLESRLDDLAVSDVQLGGEVKGLRFMVTTSDRNMDHVKSVLLSVFGDTLARNTVKFTEPTVIASVTAEAPPAKEQPPETKKEGDTSTPEKPAAPVADPYAGGSQTSLSFQRAVKHEEVSQLLAAAIDASGLSSDAPTFQLSNPEYVEGSTTAYPDWNLKILLPPEKAKTFLATMEQQVARSPIFPASSTIGAAVAGNTRLQAIYALVASWICMIIYLWIRFQGVAFGVAAVVALIHDVFVMLGAVAVSIYVAPYLGFLMIEPFKINLPIVAAFLTIIGFSVNDTIVIFDRIREVRGKNPDLTRKMVNDSVNQTLSRTLLTSFTVLLVVMMLYLFGGEAVHGLAFALLVGVATGTYSSIYIAAPILLWLVGEREKQAA